jgi:hypothetical protein
MGPALLSELVVRSDMSMDWGELCNGYQVLVLVSGHTQCVHRGGTIRAASRSCAAAGRRWFLRAGSPSSISSKIAMLPVLRRSWT